MGKYDSIINKERPRHEGDEFSFRHPQMAREDRAKIFAPFAALKGYEEAIEKQRIRNLQREQNLYK